MALDYDVFLFTAILRICVMLGCGGYLLARWIRSNKRFIIDLPLWFGLLFISIGLAKIQDLAIGTLFYDSNEGPEFLFMLQVRFVLFGLSGMILMVVVSIIWFRNRAMLQKLVPAFYVIPWILVILFARDHESLSLYSTYLVFPLIIAVIFTYLFIYHQKRLPTFHAGYAALGTIIYTVSLLLRPTLLKATQFGPFGLLPLSEVIELVSWVINFYGFVTKPPYVKKAVVSVQTPRA